MWRQRRGELGWQAGRAPRRGLGGRGNRPRKNRPPPAYRPWIERVSADIERARAETTGARAADKLARRRAARVVIADTPEIQPIPVIHIEDDPTPAEATMSSDDEDTPPAHGESCGAGSGASGSSGAPPNWEEAAWAAWHQENRWRYVDGRWYWRQPGWGPDGGSDCPRSADPARSARNQARKEQKERKRAERREREAQDPDAAGADAWNRVYERHLNQRVHELRQASWQERWG